MAALFIDLDDACNSCRLGTLSSDCWQLLFGRCRVRRALCVHDSSGLIHLNLLLNLLLLLLVDLLL